MKRAYLALLIGLTLFILPGMAFSSPVSIGKTEIVKGSVYVVRNGEHQVLGLGEDLYPLDTVVTADSGRVKLLFDDGSAVFVTANSQIGIEHYSVKYGYRISGGFNALRGKVRFIVEKVEGLDAAFSVQTKLANIEVTGTDFTIVEPTGTLPTQVLLHSGQIIAKTKKEKGYVVKPGQIARIISNGAISVRDFTPNDIASLDVPVDLPEGKTLPEKSAFDQKTHGTAASPDVKVKPSNAVKANAPKVNAPKVNAPKVKPPKI